MTAAAQIETTFREEHGRVLAALISQLGDFTLAEDALQDALVEALEGWEINGVPRNPGAWLTTVAKRRAIDRIRRSTTADRIRQASATDPESDSFRSLNPTFSVPDDQNDDDMDSIPDDRLKLMFTCCHPSLALDAQIALTLHTLGGLSTPEIARAFLVPVPTMAQRLARARGKIRAAGIPYRVPPADLLPERLDALLAVLYLIFNEGYVATGGDTLTRSDLSSEAIRLCRVLVELLPDSAEARGLLALMLLHDSRRDARVNALGELVLLEAQDRSRWNQAQIREGIAILDEALEIYSPGPYQVQAAISALHAEAATPADTDWIQIAALYDTLMMMTPSPVIEINRAVAMGMARGPLVGLTLLHRLDYAMVENYYPYHAALADLLRRTNQREAAADAYERALALCQNSAERAYLQGRLDEMLG